MRDLIESRAVDDPDFGEGAQLGAQRLLVGRLDLAERARREVDEKTAEELPAQTLGPLEEGLLRGAREGIAARAGERFIEGLTQ